MKYKRNYEYFYQKLLWPLENRQTTPIGVTTPRLKTTGLDVMLLWITLGTTAAWHIKIEK